MAPSRSDKNNEDKRDEEHKKMHHLNGRTTSRRRYRHMSPSPHQEASKPSTRNLLLLNPPLLRHDGHHDTALNGDIFVWSQHHRLDHHLGLTTKRLSSSADHRVLTSKQIMDIIDMALELTKDVCDDVGGIP